MTHSVKTQSLSAVDCPHFSELPEPRMVALYTGNGSGTKLYQGFLDGHPEILMIPAYPLMYLYPHWGQWEEELKDEWTWARIIDQFCIQHASVIDTRCIPGFDGLAKLGEEQDEYISINETLFRDLLGKMLVDEPICARTFLLAIHYAYALAQGEDLSAKKVLVYHIHVHEYVRDFLSRDFPDMLIIATVRDPRSNFFGRYNSSEVDVDTHRYNTTDAIIFRRRAYYFVMRYFYETMEILNGLPAARIRAVRHEALYHSLENVMTETSKFLGIQFHPCLLTITFGEKSWWGDPIYKMEPMNTVNPRIVSLDWQKAIDPLDWYVFEGLFYDYMDKYGYVRSKIHKLTILEKIKLFNALFVPSKEEREIFLSYFKKSQIITYFGACYDEAMGRKQLKDYTFNAYYRHKWTQKDLEIWRPRWYVENLAKALRRHDGRPNFLRAKINLLIAQTVYVGVNLSRYVFSFISYPYWIVRRWAVCFGAFLRIINKTNVYPEALE